MADEIRSTVNVRAESGSLKIAFNEQATYDMGDTKCVNNVVDVGTSAETISLGDITTPGTMWLKNLDGTNYVEFGVDNTGFVVVGRLEAGKIYGPIPCAASVTYQLKANTAACDVLVTVFEG